jgi:DNA helicase II / ATP-dependent DNA helicase PcrA
MEIKSNVEPVSTVYNLNDKMSLDKEFHKQVRGKKAIDILLQKLGAAQSTALFNKYDILTSEQFAQYEDGMYCAMHGDKQELVFGYVIKNGKQVTECRCYKHTCPMFLQCRPDYDLSILPTPINYDLIYRNNMEEYEDDSIAISHFDDMLPEVKVHDYDNTNQELVIDFDDDEYFIQLEDIVNPQDTVVEAPADEKMLVSAGPGTGKTHTLIRRIINLVEEQNVNPSDMIVLSFSRAAISEIKNRVFDNLDVNKYGYNVMHDVDIRTFDSFVTFLLKEIEPDKNLTGKDYNTRIEMGIDCIKRNTEIFDDTKHIIIDEVQDLVGVRAKLVQTILLHTNCGFTFFGDMCQAIYEYQVDGQHQMSAFEFHDWLKKHYCDDLHCYSFNKNFRQSEKLGYIGSNIRKSILNDNEVKQATVLRENIELISNLGDCQSINENMVFDPNKNYAVLCRDNGQVLKVSKHFRELNIPNTVQRPSTQKLLDRWIGELFGQLKKRYISFDEFKELSIQRYGIDELIINQRWETIKKIENRNGSRLEIDELINEIINNPLGASNLETSLAYNVIISSIHRAKGREYDEVIIVDNDIFDQSRWRKISDEIRTNYVALTRPKEKIYRMQLNSGWQRKVRDKRWISTKYNFIKNKREVSHIEIGLDKDIETKSFVDTECLGSEGNVLEVQNYINNRIKLGDPIKLLKVVNSDTGEIKYNIYHADVCIGSMSDEFKSDLFQAFMEVQRFYSKDNEKYYPSEINEVYVDQICSYTSHNINANVHTIFSSSKIWNGVYLTGIGKIRW